MKEKILLKETLFNVQKVRQLATEIKAVYPVFTEEHFVSEVMQAFPRLELKERITHIEKMLFSYLPSNYEEATEIIEKALPKELNTNKYDNDFGDFIYAPYASYIAAYGCSDEHLERSLYMLREITKRFSVEFSIRDFINAYPEETFSMLRACALSDNYHERRLASEGLRPKLPWAKKLTLDPYEALEILEILFSDKTRYVTRSVANHLNDLSKIDAPLVVKTLEKWKSSGKQTAKEMDYIVSHALRTLVKQGNVDALALLGYADAPKVKLSALTLLTKEVKIGEALHFSMKIDAEERSQLMLDYVIYFVTKRGTSSPKVHKIKKLVLEEGESVKVEKKHVFKAAMSTRTLYEGLHRVELQINGKRYDLGEFFLTV